MSPDSSNRSPSIDANSDAGKLGFFAQLIRLGLLVLVAGQIYLLVTDFSVLDWLDPPSQLGRGQMPVIGDVIEVRNSVRIQDSGDLIWNETYTGSEVRRKQSVLTLEDSAVEVRLSTGVGIAIEENSLIQLDDRAGEQDGKFIVKLLRGKIRQKAISGSGVRQKWFQPVEIEAAGGSRVQLKQDAEVSVEVLPDGGEKIWVHHGEANVISAQGNEQVVPVGEPVVVKSLEFIRNPEPVEPEKPREEEKAPPPPPPPPPPSELKDPEFIPGKHKGSGFLNLLIPSAYADEDSVLNVVLKWSEVPGASGYRIQISRTRDFGKVIQESDSDRAEWTWKYRPGMENSKGRVFYRVASRSGGGLVGAYSDPRPIQIPRSILARARQKVKQPPAPIIPTKPLETAVEPSVVTTSYEAEKGFGRIHLKVDTGFSAVHQISPTADLRSVALTRPYLNQKFDAGIAWSSGTRIWSLLLAFGGSSFEGTGAALKTRPLDFRVDLLTESATQSPIRVRWGVVAGWRYRWMKSGFTAIVPAHAISFGPGVDVDWRLGRMRLGAGVAFPLTGILTSGYWGVDLRSWIEAALLEWGELQRPHRLALRLEPSYQMAYWSTPERTHQSGWSIVLGPMLRWGEWF